MSTSNFIPIGGGTSSPAGSKQAPVIIGGNSASGDTIDDCDFLDTGNGAGIAGALALLDTTYAGQEVTVVIRPGQYDFTAGGAPSLPLSWYSSRANT